MLRHRHDDGYVTLVLGGGYAEAGDTGLHVVEAGDVIVHAGFEAHLDHFGGMGAELIDLPLPMALPVWPRGRIVDPDSIVRFAELDPLGAARRLLATMTIVDVERHDWPDALAVDLTTDPGLRISEWARTRGLHPGSIARGFQQQFGVTAAQFRSEARGRRALADIRRGDVPLARLAAGHGYADQAHMTRAIRNLVGSTPGALRKGSECENAGRRERYGDQDNGQISTTP